MANYSYVRDNGVVLTAIKASPNNITLKAIDNNVTNQSSYGINGGFFYGNALLSIAVNNDIAVKGVGGAYGSGWYNEEYARGTLVWDKTTGQYSVQVVDDAEEIVVSNRANYWAQGGISMNLHNDAAWKYIAQQQNMPNMDGLTTRTALVYSSGFNIWLVVTDSQCTAEAFRSAIKGQLGSGTMVDGIFLDGGGSSQLKCGEKIIKGDGRVVRQMVALTSV